MPHCSTTFGFGSAKCGVEDQVLGRRGGLLYCSLPEKHDITISLFLNDMGVLKNAFGEAETATFCLCCVI